MKKSLLFFYLFCSIHIISSQNNVSDVNYIKSIVFRSSITNKFTPIIKINETLMLSFDDLTASQQDFFYKIEHCNMDWTLSNLSKLEYVTGFNEDRIKEYNNSFNTLQPYTHYQLSIPNENTRLKISGNYILSVLNENDEIVFQRRFIVYEPKVTVAVSVHKSRNVANIDTHQTVQFIINNANFRINNPKEEINTVILQNNNWQTAITGLKPQFFRGDQLLYLYNKETNYWGGNEFLYFDTKSIRDAGIEIARSILEEDLYHTYLYTDESRIYQPYTFAPDINGNFIIRTLYGELDNIEADYTKVHFSLEHFENPNGKDIFISGNFNNWALNDSNKLQYNQNTGLFEVTILMKQGFYNYQYLSKDQKTGAISNYDVDGSHYQTENDYTVLVYYKPFGARYTRVIGVGLGSSKIILN